MPADKRFAGDFLFVNHNADEMNASTHRKQVFSHVQNKYRSWKRKENNRALKESLKTSLAPAPTPAQPEQSRTPQQRSKKKEGHSLPTRTSPRPAPTTIKGPDPRRITIQSLIIDEAQDALETAVAKIRGEILTRTFSPRSMVKGGNSDPFDAYAVKIDPMANEMLSFYRDFILPAIYHTTKRKWVTNASARRDWHDCIHGWRTSDGLGDEGAGTAFIASCATATALVSRNPIIQGHANHYRSKSLALLKARLAKNDCDRTQIYWHINVVLDSETFSRNRAGAVAHLQMLRHLFESDTNRIEADLLLHVVYHDIHNSSMFLCRPTFDVDRWLPAKFQPLIDAATPYLPDLSQVRHLYLDPSIDNPKLRVLFVERRESLAVWLAQSRSDEQSDHSVALLGWLQARVYLHQGRLINFFLQADAQYKAGMPPMLINSLACQGYVSLATLLYIRSISFNATVHGVRLFDATRTILMSMQEMLEVSEAPDASNYERYENARLWALYVGASAEIFMGMRPMDRGWFTINFAAKAVKLQLNGEKGWDKVRQVLRGFLYTDLMHPNGEQWYEGVLATLRWTPSESEYCTGYG
jgi:hypothetical protein